MRSYQNTEGQAEAVTSSEIVNRENELKNSILKFIQPAGEVEAGGIQDPRETEADLILFDAVS